MKISKSIVSLILTLAIVVGTFSFLGLSANAVDNALGDTNSDGAINSFDALMIIRHCTGEATLNSAQLKAADVDGNGKVSSLDALYILHYAVGRSTGFPAGDSVGNRVPIFGGLFYYDPATGQVTNENNSGLLGFAYDANEGVFFATNNAWQRNFGYTYVYDYAAPLIICNFDTTRIFFNYDGKDWMVQLWKGQYGYVLIGCEIGLYYRDENDKTLVDEKGRKLYKCADDEMLVKMSLSLYRNGHLVFNRHEQYSWWLTGFKPGALPSIGVDPKDTESLMVDAQIRFATPEMMEAFEKGLKATTDIEHNASKKVRKVSYRSGKNYTVNRKDNILAFQWQ